MNQTVSKLLADLLLSYPEATVHFLLDGDAKREHGMWAQGEILKVDFEEYVEGETQLWFYSDDKHKETLEDIGIEVHDNEKDVETFVNLNWKDGFFIYIGG